MFNPPTSIGTRIFCLSMLNRSEDHVDLAIAIGMSRNLPAGIPPLLIVLIQLLLRASGWNAEVVRTVGVSFAEPCGSTTQRVSLIVLERRDAQAIVAESLLDPGCLELVERPGAEHKSNPDWIPKIAQLLHRAERRRTSSRYSHAGNPLCGVLPEAGHIPF